MTLLLAAVFALILLTLGRNPPLWWDEGWTISVARNWLEAGHYGLFNNDLARGTGLSGHLPAVASAALGVRLFGLGVWQARLPFFLYTLGAFACLYLLARKLYTQKVALASVLSLIFLIPHPAINPLLNGRQVLGDVPAAFFLLAGYLAFLAALERSPWFVLPAAITWGLALAAKAQTLPFWLPAVAVLISLYLVARNVRAAVLGSLAAVGAYTVFLGLARLRPPKLPIAAAEPALEGYLQAVAVVPDPFVRRWALLILFLFALPTAAGLVYGLFSLWRGRAALRAADHRYPVKASLFALSGAWVAWYALLSNSGYRYLVSPVFLAAPFTAGLLDALSAGFDPRTTFRRAARLLRLRSLDRSVPAAWAALFLTLPFLVATPLVYIGTLGQTNAPLDRTLEYLNTQTPAGSLVETYESELFPFLERRYHYPPDQVHVDRLAQNLYAGTQAPPYDPIAENPDYLVLGPTGREWQLYGELIDSGQFSLVADFERYQVYARSDEP